MEMRQTDQGGLESTGSGRAEAIEQRLRDRAVDAVIGSILLDPYAAVTGDPPQALINASAAFHARDVESLRAHLPDVTAVARLAIEGLERDGLDAAAVLAAIDPKATIDLRDLDEELVHPAGPDAGNEPATETDGVLEAMPPGLRPPPPDGPPRTGTRWARRLRGRHQP
jgi:hypothetical protein